jgi:hypothetical protein
MNVVHLLYHSIAAFLPENVFYRFHMILSINGDYLVNSINRLIPVLQTHRVFFKIGT